MNVVIVLSQFFTDLICIVSYMFGLEALHSQHRISKEIGLPSCDKEISEIRLGFSLCIYYFQRYILRPKDSGVKKKNTLWRIIHKMSKGNFKLDRAEPGEKYQMTRLYSPVFTPLSQMGDFGLGVGLYFSTLRAIVILTLFAGLINVPNLIYYMGPEYSDGQSGLGMQRGSAVCTEQTWVPCPTCTLEDFHRDQRRLANGTNQSGRSMMFAKKNFCSFTFELGIVNYATVIFVILGILCMHM